MPGIDLVPFVPVVQRKLEICKLDNSLLFRHILGAQCIHQFRLQVSENRDGGRCAHLKLYRFLPAVHIVVISQHVHLDENPVHEETYTVAKQDSSTLNVVYISETRN